MMTPSYRARLALRQEAEPALNSNRRMVLPTLIISPPPHHHLQVLARSLTTTPIHRARVRLIRGDTTPFSQDPPSTRLLSPIPPCNPKGCIIRLPHCLLSISSIGPHRSFHQRHLIRPLAPLSRHPSNASGTGTKWRCRKSHYPPSHAVFLQIRQLSSHNDRD